jgi:transposase-like protein
VFIAGESLYALSKRHDISRQLIRVWVQKYEAGALDGAQSGENPSSPFQTKALPDMRSCEP